MTKKNINRFFLFYSFLLILNNVVFSDNKIGLLFCSKSEKVSNEYLKIFYDWEIYLINNNFSFSTINKIEDAYKENLNILIIPEKLVLSEDEIIILSKFKLEGGRLIIAGNFGLYNSKLEKRSGSLTKDLFNFSIYETEIKGIENIYLLSNTPSSAFFLPGEKIKLFRVKKSLYAKNFNKRNYNIGISENINRNIIFNYNEGDTLFQSIFVSKTDEQKIAYFSFHPDEIETSDNSISIFNRVFNSVLSYLNDEIIIQKKLLPENQKAFAIQIAFIENLDYDIVSFISTLNYDYCSFFLPIEEITLRNIYFRKVSNQFKLGIATGSFSYIASKNKQTYYHLLNSKSLVLRNSQNYKNPYLFLLKDAQILNKEELYDNLSLKLDADIIFAARNDQFFFPLRAKYDDRFVINYSNVYLRNMFNDIANFNYNVNLTKILGGLYIFYFDSRIYYDQYDSLKEKMEIIKKNKILISQQKLKNWLLSYWNTSFSIIRFEQDNYELIVQNNSSSVAESLIFLVFVPLNKKIVFFENDLDMTTKQENDVVTIQVSNIKAFEMKKIKFKLQ